MTPRVEITDNDRDEGRSDDRPIRVRWQAVAWVLGVLVTGLMTYNATANTMNARVAVLESQVNDMRYQLGRVNDKLDRLLDMATTRPR